MTSIIDLHNQVDYLKRVHMQQVRWKTKTTKSKAHKIIKGG